MDSVLRISDLQYQGTDAAVVRVRLEDDTVLLLDADLPVAGTAAAFLRSGEPLDDSTLESFRIADEICRCRRKALDLLARSEQCRRGLAVKLSRKGWNRPAVEAALDRLESAGYLDDRRFAESWTRSRLRRRPEGPSKLIGGLMAKGVSGGIAREAVEAVLEEAGDESGADALERAWMKLSRKPGITDEKLAAALMRRGFRSSDIRRLLSERQDGPD